MERGISGWENVSLDPGWAGITISFPPSHPDWSGRSLAELGASLDAHTAEHVIVNGRPAVLAGQETGERAGLLLRRAG